MVKVRCGVTEEENASMDDGAVLCCRYDSPSMRRLFLCPCGGRNQVKVGHRVHYLAEKGTKHNGQSTATERERERERGRQREGERTTERGRGRDRERERERERETERGEVEKQRTGVMIYYQQSHAEGRVGVGKGEERGGAG
jgi:hypothetical protein